jgi:hypothetical protein
MKREASCGQGAVPAPEDNLDLGARRGGRAASSAIVGVRSIAPASWRSAAMMRGAVHADCLPCPPRLPRSHSRADRSSNATSSRSRSAASCSGAGRTRRRGDTWDTPAPGTERAPRPATTPRNVGRGGRTALQAFWRRGGVYWLNDLADDIRHVWPHVSRPQQRFRAHHPNCGLAPCLRSA